MNLPIKDYKIVMVSALIRNNGNVLAVKRNTLPFMHIYSLPGGMLEEESARLEGLKDKVFQETGLVIAELTEDNYIGFTEFDIVGQRAILYVYKAKVIGGSPSLKEDEVEDLCWLPPRDFVSNMVDNGVPDKVVEDLAKILNSQGL